MLKTYIVRLSQEERQTLKDLVSIGKGAAYKQNLRIDKKTKMCMI
jgi:hypothetical protein